MTNRPRRSRPTKPRSRTIDLKAEENVSDGEKKKQHEADGSPSDQLKAGATHEKSATDSFASEEGLDPAASHPKKPDAPSLAAEKAAATSGTETKSDKGASVSKPGEKVSSADESKDPPTAEDARSATTGMTGSGAAASSVSKPANAGTPSQVSATNPGSSSGSAESSGAGKTSSISSGDSKTVTSNGTAAASPKREPLPSSSGTDAGNGKTGGTGARSTVLAPQANQPSSSLSATSSSSSTVSQGSEDSKGSGGGSRTSGADNEGVPSTTNAAARNTSANTVGTSSARPASASPSTSSSTADRHSGSGFGSALAGGVVGAIIALGGAAALQAGGYLPPLGTTQSGAQSAGQANPAPNGDLDALRNDVAALQQKVDASPAPGAQQPDDTALQQAVEQLKSNVSQTQETASAAQTAADQAQKTASDAGQAAQSAQQSADTATSTASSASEAAQKAQNAADSNGENLQQLTERVSGFDDRIASVQAANERATRALAAANLKSAIDRGGPFMSELETYAQATGGGGATNDLRDLAADGVPSEQSLAAQWPSVEDSIAKSLSPAQPDAPVREQILSGLKSLVQVRPTGEAAANAAGPQAALTRMDAAIRSGNLSTWQDEWQKLPDGAKDASGDFAQKVDARLTAQRVVGQALDNAISAGGGDTGSTPSSQPSTQGNQG